MTEETIDEGIEAHASSHRFTPAEKIALRYSELMGTAPERVDAALYDELAEHYSVEEIVELGAFIAFHYGMQVFLGTLDLPEEEIG